MIGAVAKGPHLPSCSAVAGLNNYCAKNPAFSGSTRHHKLVR